MADNAGEDVIRVWLETNFAQELAKGGDAADVFRAKVATMGPETERIFRTIDTKAAPAIENVAKAATKAAGGEGGGEGGGTGFAGMSRQAFMAERAINALISGQGIARAGPMLEGVMGFLGGPAGMGFAISGVALAAERYIPQLLAHFDLMGTKTEEQSKKFIESLDKMAEKYKKIVEEMEKTPAPGSGPEHAAEKRLGGDLFNEETMKSIQMKLLGSALHGDISRMIPGEIEEMQKARQEASDANVAVEHDILGLNLLGERETAAKANKALNDLEGKAAGLTVRRLLGEAKDPTTPEGKEALRQIGNLLPDLKPRIDAILNKTTTAGQDFMAHVPRNRWSERGSRFGETDPKDQKEIDALELADWQEELAKGPKSRSRAEELERRIAQAMGLDVGGSGYHPRHPDRVRSSGPNRQIDEMRELANPGPMRQIPSHSGPFEIHDSGPRRQPDAFNTVAGQQAAGFNANLTATKANIDSALSAIATHGDISGKLHEELSIQQAKYKQVHRQLRDLENRVNSSLHHEKTQQNAGGN